MMKWNNRQLANCSFQNGILEGTLYKRVDNDKKLLFMSKYRKRYFTFNQQSAVLYISHAAPSGKNEKQDIK